MRFSRFILLVFLCLVLVPVAFAGRPNITISNFSSVPSVVNNGSDGRYPSQINFTINLTNFNNASDAPDDDGIDAYNVTVSLRGADNITNATSSLQANTSEGAANLTFIIYRINNGTSFVFSVNFTTSANASGTVLFRMNITNYTNSTLALFNGSGANGLPESSLGSSNVTNTTTVNVEFRRPNITVVKTNTTGFTSRPNGTSVNFTINISNVGNMTAYNVTVFDNITFEMPAADQNYSFVNASVPANFSNNTWIVHVLGNGSSFVFTINLSVNGSAHFNVSRAFNNTVNVTNYTDNFTSNTNPSTAVNFTTFTGSGDTNSSGTVNSTATTTVNVETRRPNITISKTQGSTEGAVNYTINVSNIGNTTGFNVTVRDNFTNQAFLTFGGATIVANDTQNSTWVIFSIASGTSFIFSINLTVDRVVAGAPSSSPFDFVNFVNVTNYTDNLTYSNLNADNITRLVVFSSDGNVTNASATTSLPGGNSQSSQGSGGTGGGGSPATFMKILTLAGDGAETKTVYKADRTFLRIDDKDYQIVISAIRRQEADFSIGTASFSMAVGDSGQVDLDGDRHADLGITLSSALVNRITLDIVPLAPPSRVVSLPETMEPVIEPVEDAEEAYDELATVEDIPMPTEESIQDLSGRDSSRAPSRSRKGLVTVAVIVLALIGLLSYAIAKNPRRAKEFVQSIKDRFRRGPRSDKFGKIAIRRR